MAEGFDPTKLNEKDPLIDDDEALELARRNRKLIYPPGDGDQTIDWVNTSTSTRRGSAPDLTVGTTSTSKNKISPGYEETYFVGGDKRTKSKFPNLNDIKDEFIRKLGKYGQVIVTLTTRKNAKEYTLLNPDGSLAPDYFKKNFPKKRLKML